MLNAARDEAEELASEMALEIQNQELARVVRSYFRQGYVRGAISVIQKEIYDRVTQVVAPEKEKTDFKVGRPGTAGPKKKPKGKVRAIGKL